jgi:LPXTG-site transpeptidase (sortase) family protein
MRFSYVLLILASSFLGVSFIWPLIPEVEYRLIKAQKFISPSASIVKDHFDLAETYSENRLVIPIINVNSAIVEGESEAALSKGVWRRPVSAKPDDRAGNTVLTGHRFLYTGFAQNTFYNLDKLEVGDEIQIFWEGGQYFYKVAEISVVEPTAIEIEQDFGDTRLTLYTCHPLWTAAKRLVVVAKPLSIL